MCGVAVNVAERVPPEVLPKPRVPAPLVTHQELEFRFEDSVFRELEMESKVLQDAAFEIDWRTSRLQGNYILPASTPEEAEQKQQTFELLKQHYNRLRQAFKYYACVKGGDVFNVSWLGFTNLAEYWGLCGRKAGASACKLAVRLLGHQRGCLR